jgi:septum formation protein
MQMHRLPHEFILASESPRRKMLLEEAGFSITVFPIKVSEKLEKNLNPDAQILHIAERKNKAAVEELNRLKSKDFLLLTADTMVVLDGEPLGKPHDEKHAEALLTRLSGRFHEVKTAICLYESSTQKRISQIETTQVFFRAISLNEIREYIASGEPMDKAGAYAIQGLGRNFVEKFDGDFDNVVGLPMNLLKKILIENGWMKT